MDTAENHSEIGRLRQRIAEEYESAIRAMEGLACGTAKHQYITRRMELLGSHHEMLMQLVGEQEATRMLAETLDAL